MVRVVRVGAADLERGEHLALLFAVDERVVVLHGDEGREPVPDRVRCACGRGWSAVCLRSVAAVGRTLHGVDCGWGELACGPEGKKEIHW